MTDDITKKIEAMEQQLKANELRHRRAMLEHQHAMAAATIAMQFKIAAMMAPTFVSRITEPQIRIEL